MIELFHINKWSEWCDAEDWRSLKDKEAVHVEWDPLCVLPSRVEACWVFCENTGTLVFACGMTRGSVSLVSSKYENKKLTQLLFFEICKSVDHVSQNFEVDFSEAYNHFIANGGTIDDNPEDRERLKWMSKNCRLVSRTDREFKVVACIPKVNKEFGTSEELSSNRLLPGLMLNFSRYLMQNPTSLLVPTKYFSLEDNSPMELFENFWSPKTYVPGEAANYWIWPWQRVDSGSELRSANIQTTSLCADIRLSTKAMERTVRVVEFARFIRHAIEIMRNTLLENGGFFDKETGDGVVGHFLDEPHQNGATSAFLAAKEMARRVGNLCDSYVNESLSQKIPVGIGIGIHTGQANWFASGNQICAIGSSVVDATRICAGAAPGEVLLSLGAHRNTNQCLSAEKTRVRQLKKIEFKGLDTDVEAYSMEL